MSLAHLERLNPEQRRAVEHGVGEAGAKPGKPLLVIAGAGSGKTSTLAHRVAHLVVGGADPRRILLMTFSRRAANEMIRRVERIVRAVTGQSASVTEALSWAGTCLAIYSRCINAESPIEDVLRTSFPWCTEWVEELKKLFADYVEAKQRQSVLDYDDLLLYWAQMMSDSGLASEIGSRFDQVLVDEYQDTNRLQASILLALKPSGSGLTVVGDDAQSIYSFRAASVRNILDFRGQFSPRAEIVTLDRNYRSTQPILAAANALIDLASERYTKNLWTDRTDGELPQLVVVRDEENQARYIVERVLESREAGLLLKQQAILFRASHHSGPLEIELTRRNIPFVKFGGL